MSKVINRYTDKYIVNIIDPRLSRFFTKREMRNPDIRSDTMRKNAPIYETSSEFRNRVREQLYDMENKDEYNVIWCICHTLIIKYVAEFKNIQRDEHINYLDTVIIEI
jgi:broad specificity phosphatase PhoE